MKEFLDKLSSYNLFNYLFPGIVFVVICDKTTSFSFLQDDIVTGLFVYYFSGLVISRFGSLVLEPILKCISFVKFAAYGDFLSASKADSRIELLSEQNNMYRTIISLFVLVLLLKLYECIETLWPWLKSADPIVMIVLLLILFSFSYRKQTNYITKRIKHTEK